MRYANPPWKVLTALLSLLLAILIWSKGLEESFARPSANPAISLHQREVAYLAESTVPLNIRDLIVGANPENSLREALREIPISTMSYRERFILAALEDLPSDRSSLLDVPLEPSWEIIKSELLKKPNVQNINPINVEEIEIIKKDPLLSQVICLANEKNTEICINPEVSRNMFLRLIISQFLPFIAIIFGSGLLIRQGFLLIAKRTIPWPDVIAMPLSLIDMVILIAGGFVILGEVLTPALAIPVVISLSKGIVAPIANALRVFVGYLVMAIPPLFILSRQLKADLHSKTKPKLGWVCWGIRPLPSAFLKAFNGWLMVMPLVLLTGWLMNLFVGDQGGSNPLLEIVLSSNNFFALGLLFLTTVICAPLFEEFIFRGVLLPVLVRDLGKWWGVVLSALVFGLAHLSVGELPPLLVLGFGLALLRLSTGRLLPCILMHSLWNGVTFTSLLLVGG